MDISSSASTSESYALLAASLAKKQQTQQGQQALELIQTAAESAPAAPKSAGTSLGSNIDIRV